METRIRELESELDAENRRSCLENIPPWLQCQPPPTRFSDAHKNLRKSERLIKELTYRQDEDEKNHQRMEVVVEQLQGKIKSYKKQIEEAEEIAAINLAKFRKAQQDFEEAEERSKMCEANIAKYRSARAASEMTPGPVS